MFFHKQDYLKIEKIQYSLKIVCDNNESYEGLLLCKKEVSIHQTQLCKLGL